jgi:hypothetical protein
MVTRASTGPITPLKPLVTTCAPSFASSTTGRQWLLGRRWRRVRRCGPAVQQADAVSGIVLIGPFVRAVGSAWQLRLYPVLFRVLFARPWGTSVWTHFWAGLFPSQKPADFEAYSQHQQPVEHRPSRGVCDRRRARGTRCSTDGEHTEVKRIPRDWRTSRRHEAVDTRSKRILMAWITRDIFWAVLFIRAMRRARSTPNAGANKGRAPHVPDEESWRHA